MQSWFFVRAGQKTGSLFHTGDLLGKKSIYCREAKRGQGFCKGLA